MVYADVSSAVVLPASAVAGTVVTGTATFTNQATAGTSALAVTGTVTLSNGDVKPFTVGTLTVGQSSVQTFTTTMPSTVGTTALSATSTVATTTPESNTANNVFTGATTTALFADPGVLVNSIPAGTPGRHGADHGDPVEHGRSDGGDLHAADRGQQRDALQSRHP